MVHKLTSNISKTLMVHKNYTRHIKYPRGSQNYARQAYQIPAWSTNLHVKYMKDPYGPQKLHAPSISNTWVVHKHYTRQVYQTPAWFTKLHTPSISNTRVVHKFTRQIYQRPLWSTKITRAKHIKHPRGPQN